MAALVTAVVPSTALLLAVTAYLLRVTGGRVPGLGRCLAMGSGLMAAGGLGAALRLDAAWLLVPAGAAVPAAFLLRRLGRAHARLLAETRYDGLTSLLSRREGLAVARQLLAQGQRHGFPVAAAVLDVDHFKRVNDALGHRAGDGVLAEVAARVRSSLRAGDFAVRLGGEEFVIFLSHATEDQAAEAGWRILRGIRLRPVSTTAGDLSVTASVGVAQAGRGEALESLVERADAALYEAKRSGRDRVRAHSRLFLAAAGA